VLYIFTDGGCSGNPGPGGWAYVMVEKTPQGNSVLEEKWGGEKNTTNNRMELLAVISALKALKAKEFAQPFTLCTDSQYVQKGISQWIHNWKRNSWRTSDKKPVKNQDLWTELDALTSGFSITWAWIKGHAGNQYNERCDALAQKVIASL